MLLWINYRRGGERHEVAHDAAFADELVAGNGPRRAFAVGVDVTDEQAVQAMVRQAVLAYGGVDILVASAGLATSAPLVETGCNLYSPSLTSGKEKYFLFWGLTRFLSIGTDLPDGQFC